MFTARIYKDILELPDSRNKRNHSQKATKNSNASGLKTEDEMRWKIL